MLTQRMDLSRPMVLFTGSCEPASESRGASYPGGRHGRTRCKVSKSAAPRQSFRDQTSSGPAHESGWGPCQTGSLRGRIPTSWRSYRAQPSHSGGDCGSLWYERGRALPVRMHAVTTQPMGRGPPAEEAGAGCNSATARVGQGGWQVQPTPQRQASAGADDRGRGGRAAEHVFKALERLPMFGRRMLCTRCCWQHRSHTAVGLEYAPEGEHQTVNASL